MKTSLFTLSAVSALMLATTASAQQQNQQQGGSFLEQVFGNVFGNNQAAEQSIESDWNQGRRPFEQRREQLYSRIDVAVRDGSMSRNDADYMRREYEDIVRLEAQYSANGPMQAQQRNELRTRYRALAQRVGNQGNGQANGQNWNQNGYQGGYQDDGRWQPLAQQNGLFEQRLAEAVRNRSMSSQQANRLRADWRNLAQIEARYAYNGIDAREEADLRSRYSVIDNRLGGMLSAGFGNDRNTQRWRMLETRLIAAQRAGRINPLVLVQLRLQINDLERLDAAYAQNGYNADERAYLTRRYGELDAAMGYSRR